MQALVGHAVGDHVSCDRAVGDYIRACDISPATDDLTLGTAGHLVGLSLLYERVRAGSDTGAGADTFSAIRSYGTDKFDLLVANIRQPMQPPYLGFAHGRAGRCFAALQWCEVTSSSAQHL